MDKEIKNMLDDLQIQQYNQVYKEGQKALSKINVARAAWEENQQLAQTIIEQANITRDIVSHYVGQGSELPDTLVEKIKGLDFKLGEVEQRIIQKCSNYCSALMTESIHVTSLWESSKTITNSETAICGKIGADIRQVRQKIAQCVGFNPSIFE